VGHLTDITHQSKGEPTMIDKDKLAEVWTTMKVNDIAEKYEMTAQSVYALARRCGLPSRLDLAGLNDGPGEDDPTPEQIEERTKAIRESWPDGEHERRASYQRRVRYEFPRIETSAFFGTAEAASYSRI
jgi:hypothetical protein